MISIEQTTMDFHEIRIFYEQKSNKMLQSSTFQSNDKES